MEVFFELGFGVVKTSWAILDRDVFVDLGVEGAVRGIDDSRGPACCFLFVEKVAEVAGDIGVLTGDNLFEEGGADEPASPWVTAFTSPKIVNSTVVAVSTRPAPKTSSSRPSLSNATSSTTSFPASSRTSSTATTG